MSPQRRRTDASINALAVAVVAFSLLAGCANNLRVDSAAAPGVNFGAFQTFSFFSDLSTDRAGYHALVSQQLMFSARREMETRGFRFVDNPDDAQLLINFYAHVAEQVRVRSTPDPWVNRSFWNHRHGAYRPWPGHHSWPAHSNVSVDQFSEGRLNVDVIDTAQQMLVWEGVASQHLTQRTLSDLGPALDTAIHQIFAEFPIPPRL